MDDGYLSAAPILWPVAKVSKLKVNGKIEGFQQATNDALRRGLPKEFLFHQVMDVDPTDADSIHKFIEKWGLPFHPSRENEGSAEVEALAAIDRTERLISEYYREDVERLPDGSIRKVSRIDSPAMCISLAEAALTIATLKDAAQDIQEYLIAGLSNNECTPPDISIISLASCHQLLPVMKGCYQGVSLAHVERNLNAKVIIGRRRLVDRGLLTSAICNQTLDMLSLAQPWRKCEARGCDTVFKQKNSLRLTKDGRFADSRYSKYCSDRCYERQSKYNKSHAAKNRIDHGITGKGH
jgi:hypothetical protein